MHEPTIRKDLKELLKESPQDFPFLAQYYEFQIDKLKTSELKYLEFGKYNSISLFSKTFYRPISRIIDFSKIEN